MSSIVVSFSLLLLTATGVITHRSSYGDIAKSIFLNPIYTLLIMSNLFIFIHGFEVEKIYFIIANFLQIFLTTFIAILIAKSSSNTNTFSLLGTLSSLQIFWMITANFFNTPSLLLFNPIGSFMYGLLGDAFVNTWTTIIYISVALATIALCCWLIFGKNSLVCLKSTFVKMLHNRFLVASAALLCMVTIFCFLDYDDLSFLRNSFQYTLLIGVTDLCAYLYDRSRGKRKIGILTKIIVAINGVWPIMLLLFMENHVPYLSILSIAAGTVFYYGILKRLEKQHSYNDNYRK
jgi:hypothetical protein